MWHLVLWLMFFYVFQYKARTLFMTHSKYIKNIFTVRSIGSWTNTVFVFLPLYATPVDLKWSRNDVVKVQIFGPNSRGWITIWHHSFKNYSHFFTSAIFRGFGQTNMILNIMLPSMAAWSLAPTVITNCWDSSVRCFADFYCSLHRILLACGSFFFQFCLR